jgi:hypothetical protein
LAEGGNVNATQAALPAVRVRFTGFVRAQTLLTAVLTGQWLSDHPGPASKTMTINPYWLPTMAVRMRSVTSLGWDSMTRWEDSISMVVMPARW